MRRYALRSAVLRELAHLGIEDRLCFQLCSSLCLSRSNILSIRVKSHEVGCIKVDGCLYIIGFEQCRGAVVENSTALDQKILELGASVKYIRLLRDSDDVLLRVRDHTVIGKVRDIDAAYKLRIDLLKSFRHKSTGKDVFLYGLDGFFFRDGERHDLIRPVLLRDPGEYDGSRSAVNASCGYFGTGHKDLTATLAAFIDVTVIHLTGELFELGECVLDIFRSIIGIRIFVVETVGIRKCLRVDNVAARRTDQSIKSRIIFHRCSAARTTLSHSSFPPKKLSYNNTISLLQNLPEKHLQTRPLIDIHALESFHA